MTIRRAGHTDASAIAELATQLGYPSSPRATQRRLTAAFDRPDHVVLVAEHDGSVVGWVHVFLANRIETDPFAEVGGLVVDASHRSRGVGAALLGAAEQWASNNGCDIMRIRTNIIRECAHGFYEKRGYTRSKQQSVFGKELEPAKRML